MAERKNKLYKRIDSAEVQGEGSYVVMRSPTWEDFQDLNLTDPEEANNPAVGYEIIKRLVVDWDWVDDDGEELPKPVNGNFPILPLQEILFLVEQIDLGSFENRKKSKGESETP